MSHNSPNDQALEYLIINLPEEALMSPFQQDKELHSTYLRGFRAKAGALQNDFVKKKVLQALKKDTSYFNFCKKAWLKMYEPIVELIEEGEPPTEINKQYGPIKTLVTYAILNDAGQYDDITFALDILHDMVDKMAERLVEESPLVTELRRENQNLIDEVSSWDSKWSKEIHKHNQALNRLQKKNKKLKEKISHLETTSGRLGNELGELRQDKKKLGEQLQGAISKQQQVPKLQQEVSQLKKERNDLQEQLSSANRALDKNDEEICELETKVANYKTLYDSNISEAEKLREEKEGLTTSLEAAQSQLLELQGLLTAAKKVNEERLKAISELTKRLEVLKAEIAQLKINRQQPARRTPKPKEKPDKPLIDLRRVLQKS